ncbi:helix-turn-helix domain-containing protein [Proteiniclasticum ruminis]|uniref:helix-turn-helix domain-containing protein n=1 Tax=Proteiniclasticum ruminis TaxID=398199 RepID=UPI0028AE583C|nr:hypothetical protein [Proteiniclasticum ruminis]
MTGAYSQEIRKAVLGRVTGANKESVRKVEKELNINKATIYNWIHEAELEGNEEVTLMRMMYPLLPMETMKALVGIRFKIMWSVLMSM